MKNKWFFEKLHPHIQLGLEIKKTLYEKKTPWQKMAIVETYEFGRALILDGVIQTTQKDEAFYHEMLTHIPMLTHPRPEKVLIIGGGDGGILREVLKHPSVKKAVLVEIDKKVIELCQKYLPSINQKSFSHPKAEIVIADGAKFVRESKEKFDVILIDSPDPLGPAKVLFSSPFYRNLHKIMKPQSIVCRQSGSSILQKEELRSNFKLLKKEFQHTAVYLASIPTYIGGLFSFLIASDKINPQDISLGQKKQRVKRLKKKMAYFNLAVWQAAFLLPEYARRMVK